VARLATGAPCARGLTGSLLAPDVNPAMARLVLGRSTYTTTEEREAETVASLILGQPGDSPPRKPAKATGAAPVLCRLEHAWSR
jgi:hypothetical protein